jgi:hypothetical protein
LQDVTHHFAPLPESNNATIESHDGHTRQFPFLNPHLIQAKSNEVCLINSASLFFGSQNVDAIDPGIPRFLILTPSLTSRKTRCSKNCSGNL